MIRVLVTIFVVTVVSFSLPFFTGCESEAQTGALLGSGIGAGVGALAGGDTEATLISVFKKLKINIPPDIIKKAIHTFDFKRLSGRKAGVKDNRQWLRSGIIGDWKNYFSASDLSYFRKKSRITFEILDYCID